jgi:25S rRNA (uracil2634-N3)-methyltransferase
MVGRVLLLGEGNFTFALDLAELLNVNENKNENENEDENEKLHKIVATSFDTRSQLVEKYPTVEKVLFGLHNCDAVQVIHSIDATKDLESQLKSQDCTIDTFNHVIFNFPHLGYEDMKAHSSLIAHILHRLVLFTILSIGN